MRALVLVAMLWSAESSAWTVLSNCSLVASALNDGDSFAVRTDVGEVRIRLYHVDAPEKDDSDKGRVDEQAAYFTLTRAQVVKVGVDARAFAARELSGRFDVETRYQSARSGRIYANVRCRGGDLAAMLVSNGLARIHGAPVAGRGDVVAALLEAEKVAIEEKRGAWRHSMSGKAKPFAP